MAFYRQSVFILRNLILQTSSIPRTETRNIKRWVSPTLRELKRRKDKLGVQPELPKSSFLEWNHQAEIYAFGKRLNENFDKHILQKALTNRSYILQEEIKQKNDGIENPNINLEDNANLIREGEKFIIDCVKEQLKTVFPKFPTEGIEAVCNYLTSKESLANVAIHIGLSDIIMCAEYPPDSSTLSSTFKAVVTALINSSGKTHANIFIQDFVVHKQLVGKDINEMWHIANPLEMLKILLKDLIEPRLCNHSGGNTILAAYQIGLYVNKHCVGLGWGESIEIAIEMAARDGLKRLFDTDESRPALTMKQFNASTTANKRNEISN